MNNELKPCPFCGHKAILRHDGLHEKQRNAPNMSGDYFTLWTAICVNCGTAKGKYRTDFIFNAFGELEIYSKCDGKKDATEAWNRRADVEVQNGEMV